MKCVSCHESETRVVDSRPDKDHEFQIVRQRACTKCGHRFATYESTFNGAAHRQARRRGEAGWRARNPEVARAIQQRKELKRQLKLSGSPNGVSVNPACDSDQFRK